MDASTDGSRPSRPFQSPQSTPDPVAISPMFGQTQLLLVFQYKLEMPQLEIYFATAPCYHTGFSHDDEVTLGPWSGAYPACFPMQNQSLKTAPGATQDRKEKTSFFNWFYFAVNIGSLIACSVIVYVQENISWAVGFAIPAAAMALAVIIFISGSKKYTHVLPSER